MSDITIHYRMRKWLNLKKKIKKYQDSADKHYVILLDHAIDLRKKKKKGDILLINQDDQAKLIEPQQTIWDMDKLKSVIQKNKKSLKKADVAYEDLIETREVLNTRLLDDLLKKKVISAKEVGKCFTLNPIKPYLKIGKVGDEDLEA